MKVMGIDPGNNGALVVLDSDTRDIESIMPMPMTEELNMYCKPEVCPLTIRQHAQSSGTQHIFCELPTSYGMGTTSAFTYGYNFALLAYGIGSFKVTWVRPTEWAKLIHMGMDKDLKPKAKSMMAFEALFYNDREVLKGKTKQQQLGIIDATLIAYYGTVRIAS